MNLFEFLRLQGVDISRYLPKFLHDDNKSIKDVLDVCSWEHEKQRNALIDIAKQFFVETATWGLSDWERIVEVKPGPADTYEQRRNRILLKLNGTRTSTVQFMEELARRYVSEDSEVSVEEIPEEYLFILRLMKGSILYSQDLVDAIRTYIPAHLGWILQLEREVKFDDDDTIRYGLTNLVSGLSAIGVAPPTRDTMPYALGTIADITGLRTLGVGPVNFDDEIFQSFGSAMALSGRKDIGICKGDLPAIFSDRDARIASFLGFGMDTKGKRFLRLALPGSGMAVIGFASSAQIMGRKVHGLAPPDSGILVPATGIIKGIGGLKEISADLEDLPPGFREPLSEAKAREWIGIAENFKGRKRICLAKPAPEESRLGIGGIRIVTGHRVIGADLRDLDAASWIVKGGIGSGR